MTILLNRVWKPTSGRYTLYRRGHSKPLRRLARLHEKRLETGVWTLQGFELGGRGLPPQRHIAPGKAPELVDQVLVQLRVTGPAGVAQAADQLHRHRLVPGVFAVLERQVQEQALPRRQGLVVAGIDGLAGQPPGNRVGGVGTWITAKQVARELVEHDDRGQCGA